MSGAGGTNETRPIGRGSKYQRTLLYNSHLPYSELLEDEGNELFEQIKSNLSAAVQKSELWPGALYWTNRLARLDTRVYTSIDSSPHCYSIKERVKNTPSCPGPYTNSQYCLLVNSVALQVTLPSSIMLVVQAHTTYTDVVRYVLSMQRCGLDSTN